MKSVKTMMIMVAIATASLSFTSCDERPWDEPWDNNGWDDPYGWSGNYGSWGWNNNSYNDGQNGSQDNTLTAMAETLCGEWYGTMSYSELSSDGNSRTTSDFYADMKFFQYGSSKNSTSGEGVETDYIYNSDGSIAEQQTLEFSWYIESNGDIYIKYKNSGSTYVMDYGSSQAGFHLGAEQGKNTDTFYGYMIGTGSVKGDVIYIDLERQSTTYSKETRANDTTVTPEGHESFGNATHLNPIRGTEYKLNSKR